MIFSLEKMSWQTLSLYMDMKIDTYVYAQQHNICSMYVILTDTNTLT